MHETNSLFRLKKDTLIEKLCQQEIIKEKVSIYQHMSKGFVQEEIYLYDNVIVMKSLYFELSKCYHEIKLTKTKNCDCLYVIILLNSQGKEFIIANNEQQMKRIQVLLKRFCINKNFFGKYQLLQRNCLPISQAIKLFHQGCYQNGYMKQIIFIAKII